MDMMTEFESVPCLLARPCHSGSLLPRDGGGHWDWRKRSGWMNEQRGRRLAAVFLARI